MGDVVPKIGVSSCLPGEPVFTARVLAADPLLPVDEAGRLNDPLLRETFVEPVFARARLDPFPPPSAFATMRDGFPPGTSGRPGRQSAAAAGPKTAGEASTEEVSDVPDVSDGGVTRPRPTRGALA